MAHWRRVNRQWSDIVTMITAEKIQVYESFSGLWDGLALTGNAHQKDLFEGNDDWHQLANFYQDILLINNKLASTTYIDKALEKMHECCDQESYLILMGKVIL
jgi:hypothetical protein